MQDRFGALCALACWGNAALGGKDVGDFAAQVKASSFITSLEFFKSANGKEERVASNANEWFEYVKKEGAKGIRVRDPVEHNFRTAGALVWDDNTWWLEVVKGNDEVEKYGTRWKTNEAGIKDNKWNLELVNHKVKSDRGWSETYSNVTYLRDNLRDILTEMIVFAEENVKGKGEDGESYVEAFSQSLQALDNPDDTILSDRHKSIWLPGQLSKEYHGLILASIKSWVYTANGTWKEETFGEDFALLTEFTRLSREHFDVICESIAAASSSTQPFLN
mmetsp:Transcript_11052/g.12645  ORF Transcript_11052/g.12645 Transcript_11052/m.12645 type:complete len:277 (+) Transcript_11052:65-895(+)